MTTYTVEQVMNADEDTIIITDPCYILRDEDWSHWLDMEFTANPIGLDNYLRQYHNFGELIAADTGYGDWCNEIYNTETGETIGQFTADAGMVIVCRASDLDNYGYDINEINKLKDNGCLVTMPNYSGEIELCYEYNKDGSKLAVIHATGRDRMDINFKSMSWDKEE